MRLEDIHFVNMLKAREFKQLSNCKRRQIGVYIPINKDSVTSAIGFNSTPSEETCCKRDLGYCTAIHAEVSAILNLGGHKNSASSLYIWAETPCLACLSFIKTKSFIRTIYCLTAESYALEYPAVMHRPIDLQYRMEHAQSLGLDVVRLDAKEIEEYELSRINTVPQ